MYRTAGKQNADRNGFTTVELMVVVAIFTIALALAIPSLMQLRRSLYLMELDGTAREIFLSAQNDLTDLKASRGLEVLSLGGGLREEHTVPSGGTVYYVTSQDLDTVFGAGSGTSGLLGTLPGESVIYLNPETGDVTDVYYAVPALAYSAVKQLRDELGTSDDRDRRAELRIGYYGGLSQTSPKPEEEPPPQGNDTLTLVNKEDLYFTLAYPAIGQDAFHHPEKVLAEITLRDEHGNTFVLQADGAAAKDDRLKPAVFSSVGTDGAYSLQIVLDSMVPGLSFGELFPTLTAGDDISVSATLLYGGKIFYRNAPAGTQNSLFAAKYPGDITVGGVLHRQGVEFSYVRHLSNLRHYQQNNTAAVQTADIDFGLLARLRNGTEGEAYKSLMLPQGEHRAKLPVFFSPVDVTAVSGTKVDGRLDANRTFSLKNFKISGGVSGLFGAISAPVTLQNLRLVDCTVTGTRETGALVGSIHVTQHAVIRNCGVYQSAQDKGSVTGAASPTGGLIGHAQGPISIEQSFAAVKVTAGNTWAGGLIGQAAQVDQIKNCYASGAVTALGVSSAAGGLIGRALATEIESSFSSSNVTADDKVGALVGDVSAAGGPTSIKNSYACGIVHAANRSTYGPVAGAGTPAYVNTRYLSQSGDGAVQDAHSSTPAVPRPEGVTACEYDVLAQGVSNQRIRCHPYDPALRGQAYPFPMVTEDYYGDWPSRFDPEVTEPVNGNAYGLSYYEEYADGSWGFYSFDEDDNLMDSLDYTNRKTIVRTGYAVVVSAGKTNVKPPSIETWRYVELDIPIWLSDRNIDVYPIIGEEQLATHINQASRQITDNETGRLFYFNPYFGATLSRTQILANEETPVHIRTEKQLATRHRISDAWYFKQTHDITVTGASFSIAGQTVSAGGFSNNTAGAVYDGSGNTIYNLGRPLFSTNNAGAVIKDLTLTNFAITNSPQNDVGALAERNNTGGLITNCHVRSGTVASQSGNVAGLVGRNLGTITSASVTDVTVSAANGYAVGFAGHNQGTIDASTVENATISASSGNATGFMNYSEGVVKNSSVQTAFIASETGHVAGFVMHTQGTIEDVRVENATITATAGSGNATGFVSTNAGAIIRCHTIAAVTSANGNASGFAMENQSDKVFKNCTASGSVNTGGGGTERKYAAGFLGLNKSGQYRVEACDASAMKVRAPLGYASGFVDTVEWSGKILNCIASTDILGQYRYDFAYFWRAGTIDPAP